MATLLLPPPDKIYLIKDKFRDLWEQCESLKGSSTVYIVNRVIMGINYITKTPCGFAFIEYYRHEDAVKSIHTLNKRILDGRPIKVELDTGFYEGRQYGRGQFGGQVYDELRHTYDQSRGGHGTRDKLQIQQQQRQQPGFLPAPSMPVDPRFQPLEPGYARSLQSRPSQDFGGFVPGARRPYGGGGRPGGRYPRDHRRGYSGPRRGRDSYRRPDAPFYPPMARE